MSASPSPSQPTGVERWESVDLLRGFAMLGIIGGDELSRAFGGLGDFPLWATLSHQFSHAPWEGFTFYDLIFPLFLFVVGVSVSLALPRQKARLATGELAKRILRRTGLLLILGVLYYGGISKGWDQARVAGVLQRIAVCYVAVACIHLGVKPRFWPGVWLALVGGYGALLAWVPPPGASAPTYSEAVNWAQWVDVHFLPGKLWYGHYDPEGLLSTIPAIGTTLLGLMAGHWYSQTEYTWRRRLTGLAAAGVLLLLAGCGLGTEVPVIKKIWTASYVLVAGGWSLLLLAAFGWLADHRSHGAWLQPLRWVGANALFIYLLCRLIDFEPVARFFVGGPIATWLASLHPGLDGLVVAFTGITLCVAVCGFMFRRGWFIKL